MTYKFYFKNKFFYKSRVVVGHRYEPSTDKMNLYLPNGGIEEVANWKVHSAKLGPDWVVYQKQMMEQQAGQAIPVNR